MTPCQLPCGSTAKSEINVSDFIFKLKLLKLGTEAWKVRLAQICFRNPPPANYSHSILSLTPPQANHSHFLSLEGEIASVLFGHPTAYQLTLCFTRPLHSIIRICSPTLHRNPIIRICYSDALHHSHVLPSTPPQTNHPHSTPTFAFAHLMHLQPHLPTRIIWIVSIR
jgi:hypothetical protein